MAISVKTDLGTVKISDQVIGGIITDILDSPDLSKKIWPAEDRGRQFGRRPKIVDSDIASYIETSADDNGDVTIEFSVIVRFGVSIKTLTRDIADRIVDRMQYILGIKPSVIIINIAGVKSGQIATRKTRTIYRYDKENQDEAYR